jgi:ATP-dependent protease HslVU (ClpYQ) peptidase subunit
MTTIAANKLMMAGDRQFTHNSGMKLLGKTKILQVPLPEIFDCKKAIIGFAGNAEIWGDIVAWLHSPEGKAPRCRDIEFLMLQNGGKLFHATNMQNWLEIKDPFYAIGNGMQYAQAAMASGKDPYEACKIASKYDPMTGLGFNKITL